MRYRDIAEQIRQHTNYIERGLTKLNELADQLDKIDSDTPQISNEALIGVRDEGKMLILEP